MGRYGDGTLRRGDGTVSSMELTRCSVCATPILPSPDQGPKHHSSRKVCSQACGHRAMTIRAERTFWDKVVRMPTGCWEWQATRTQRGYGRVSFRGRPTTAHRAAYEMTHGPIPEGMWVMHSCDNPPCCNPDHLSVGTPSDNAMDMVRKGRANPPMTHGSRIGTAKLTEALVAEIRTRRKSGESVRSLARQYSVSRKTVRNVVTGAYWRHVEV